MSSLLSTAIARGRRWAVAIGLCTTSVLVSLALAPGTRASGQTTTGAPTTGPAPAVISTTTPVKVPGSATLEQCTTSTEQAERSATFAGEMTTIPGTAKMEMRIDVLERMPHETEFHVVTAPGLGVWRTAAPGVKAYRYLRQVTNLSAPASYRAAIRFRWVNAKGRTIRTLELKTPHCLQPVAPTDQPSPEEVAAAG
jgi:hypothetical protein